MILSRELRSDWTIASKVIFRFIALYFLIYILFMFLGKGIFQSLFAWIGQDVLHVKGRLEYFPTGSGDTTMAYVSLFTQTVLACIGTIIWSFLDRKRPSYNQFFYWTLIILRIFLIFFMFSYGFVKIFKGQFPGPSLGRLLQPLGEMSPMGLAWTYMGHSEGFNMFVGGMEVLGGLLLIPRKTLTLGAFITVGVMTQVAMMNFFYDIPVKLFSVHLALMALVIFLADWKRFTQVFIKNQTALAIQYYKVSDDKLYKNFIIGFKIIAMLFLIGSMSWRGYNAERQYGDKREKPVLYGIWETTTFIKNRDTIPPLLTDTNRWRRLIISYKERANIQVMNDSMTRTSFIVDTTNAKIYIDSKRGVDDVLMYTLSGKNHDELYLEGVSNGDSLKIYLKAKDLSKIELTNRGFHWINETPYNR
ncbi:hypothetical protein [Dokdonia sp.]|uniref:DoxX family protein n=1 Tax=Dokdonia sp. TaxID=2024995 RepID=UPI0032654D8D